MPVAEGGTLPNAAFRRTLNECGLPLDAVVLAGKPGRSYLESMDEDAADAKWRARAKMIDERFLHDIDTGAHDPENPMAFLEPSTSLDVSPSIAPVAAALRKEREDATGVIAGPAAAVLRAVQRTGTFTAEDLGESGDPEAPVRRGVPSLIFLRGGAADTSLSDVELETPSHHYAHRRRPRRGSARCSRRRTWTYRLGPTVRWRRSGLN